MGNRSCLALSVAFLFLAIVASLPGAPKESTPATTTKLAVSDVEASKPIDLSPRVNVVAQVSKPDVAFMTLPELQEALDCAKQEVAAIEDEITRRTPKQVAAPVKASTCDPNCQCAVTGVCTCGPDCNCTCPKAASGVAVANPTSVVTYQNVQETTYETRVGPFGGVWQVPVTRVVSRPVVTSSTTVVTSRPISVSSPSRVVTTSYPVTSVRVSTPVSNVSSTTRSASPVVMRRVCSGGVCRLVPQ